MNNKYNLPTDQWNQLGNSGQSNFNSIYETLSQQREQIISGIPVPSGSQEQFNQVVDQIIQRTAFATAKLQLTNAQ